MHKAIVSFSLLFFVLCLPGVAQTPEIESALEEFKLEERMKHYGVPGISFALIDNGQLVWAKGYGVLQEGKSEKVNTETLFSVGSISKMGTAVAALKLMEQGQVNLDKDINTYLKAWKVPENQFTRQQPVTLRRIMSHTAGLTVHGFADFQPGETLPTTVQVLNGKSPAKNSAIYVDIPVGSRFRYSGGGTTVQQLLIEELTGKEFHLAIDDLLFTTLKMQRSSYQNPLPASLGNIAKAHNNNGSPVALPRGYQAMPEAAASGLWTTPSDFSKVMIMLMEAYHVGNSYLSPATVKDMMTPVAPSEYGLGPRIRTLNGRLTFAHGGANDSYRARFIGYLDNKDGFIIFTNGSQGNGLINELVPVFDKVVN